MSKTRRRQAAALVAGVLLAVSAVPSEPQPPQDPKVRAEVERLVGELGHWQYKVREGASERLLQIGDDAVWALRKASLDADPEVSQRAGELLEQIAWVSPEVREEIDEWVETLQTTRDLDEGLVTVGRLMDLGKPGLKALRALFAPQTVEEGDASLTVTLDGNAARGDAPLQVTARIENRGKAPFWIRVNGFSCAGLESPEPVSAGSAAGSASPTLNRLFSGQPPGRGVYWFVHLAPGESHAEELFLTGLPDIVGSAELKVRYDGGQLHGPRFAKPRPEETFEPAAAPLSLSASAGRLYLLPSGRPSGEPPATLTVELERAAFASGEPIPYRLALTGKDPRGIRIACPRESAPGRGFWAAFLDEKGRIAAMKSLADPLAPSEEVLPVKQDQVIPLKGEIPQALPAGTYRLLVGYSARSQVAPVHVGKRAPPKPQAPGPQASPWSGDLSAAPATLTIR